MRLRAALLGVALAAGIAAPAAAQIQPPSLTADTGFAFAGVSEYDFLNSVSDVGSRAAIDPASNRSYAVGSTELAGGESAIAVVARRADGSLDTSFAGDGTLALSVTPGQDAAAADVVLLPDGRLRVLGATDVDPGVGFDLDIALVGLRTDGTLDPGFGTGGIEVFPAGGDDRAGGLAIDGQGRLAVTGSADAETFLAVRRADGSPEGAVELLDRDPTVAERGEDVAWSNGFPVALIDTAAGESFLHSFGGGFDTPIAISGATSVSGGGVLSYGGHIWAAGTTTVSADDDAYLARIDATGGDLQVRRFDVRAPVFAASQPVDGAASDLTLVPGDPDTLVVGGSSSTDAGTEWALAAFNGLDGSLDALQMAQLVVPVAGQGGASGVAGAPGGVVAGAGTLVDSAPGNPGTGDLSISTARVLVDAEKRCDMALAITSPVELVLRGKNAGAVAISVSNHGARPCSGALSLPAPWTDLSGQTVIGRLLPGQTVTRTLQIAYGAALPATGLLELTLAAAGDAALGDNVARLPVVFSFCDLQLSLLDAPPVLGTEGTRRFAFRVRNVGTAACRASQVYVAASGVRVGAAAPFTVQPGKSAEEAFNVGVTRGTKSGRPVALSFSSRDVDDVSADNNGAAAAPMVVRPGDTTARKPTRAGTFTGSARPGAAKNVSKRTLRVRSVQIAVLRAGKGCAWLGSASGELRTVDAGPGGRCDELVWVTVSGTKQWKLKLRERLPKGRYTLRSRAVLANGVAEGRFSRGDKNLVTFSVR